MSRMNTSARTGFLTRTTFALVALISTAFAASESIYPVCAQDSPLKGFANALGNVASAEDTVIETETATFSMKKIELHGTGLTNDDLTAILDPKLPASIADRLAKLSADEIVIPEIIVTTKTVPIQTAVYQNIKLTNVRQGQVETGDIGSVHSNLTDEKTDTVESSYENLHAQAIDLALASHVMSGARKDENEPLKRLYDSFSIKDVKLTNTGKEAVSVSIADISGHNVKARPLAMHPDGLQPASAGSAQLAATLKDVLISVSIEDFKTGPIEVSLKPEDRPVSISLAKMSIEKLSDAKIGDIAISAFKINAQGSTVSIGDIDLKATDFQKLHDFSTAAVPKESSTEADASQQAAIFVPNISQFIVNKINVSLSDDNDPSSGINGTFSISHFEVDEDTPADKKPTHVTAALDHFILDTGSFKSDGLKPLTDMGYAKLDLSSRIEMAWDPEAEELTIKDISVSGTDMGAVKVTGVVDNVTKDFFSGDSGAMQLAALGALVKKAEIQIDNAGLFEKAVAVQAKSQNKPVEDIKQSYITAAATGIPAMLGNKPAAKMIGAALAKFFANPISFHLAATSADGLGAADVALARDPAALLDMLEIKAIANE